ncbi:uncharacterized protein TRAVEDRAFT_28195, partial [Trametes versicolor FP-101664 SS1]|uniref:uncharacterized protein n=1 Tax=Trametes versicolor (strain FP-101664) TaxID=717944 RepID=UPI0004623738
PEPLDTLGTSPTLRTAVWPSRGACRPEKASSTPQLVRDVASGTCGVRPVHRAHSGDGSSHPAVANGLRLAQQAGSSPWGIDEGVDHNQAVERRSQTA